MASLESCSMAREYTSGEGAKPLDCKERDTLDREQSYRLVFFISSFCFRCIISSRCYSLAIKLVRIRTIYALSKKESC